MLLEEIQKKIEAAKIQKAEMLKELQRVEEQTAQYLEAAKLIGLAEKSTTENQPRDSWKFNSPDDFNTSIYSARRVGVYDVHAYKCGCGERKDEHVVNIECGGAKWEVEFAINEDLLENVEDRPVFTEKNGGIRFHKCWLEMSEAREEHYDE